MALKHLGFVLGATVLATTACSKNKAYTRTEPVTTNPSPSDMATTEGESIAQEKDALISQADGSQLGTLRDYSGTSLTLDSEGSMGQDSGMTVRADNSVPVFQGEQKVSTDALVPGSDVRVFYRTPADGTQPQAVAIEILTTGQDTQSPTTPDDSGLQSPTTPDDSGLQSPMTPDDSGLGSEPHRDDSMTPDDTMTE